MTDSSNPVFDGLISRGYSPVHAAALAGHAAQESGGNPAAINPKEDAHGLLQWRLDRWKGLQDFAKTRGTDPTDLGTQLDFIGREFSGPEAKSGSAFLAASDLPSASAALKPYIRFGDSSDAVRLRNATGFLDGAQGSSAPAAPSAAPTTSAPAPVGILNQAQSNAAAPGILNSDANDTAAVDGFRAKLGDLMSQQQQPAPLPTMAPIAMALPRGLPRAKLLAALSQPLGA